MNALPRSLRATVVAVALASFAVAAPAKKFTWTNDGDVTSMDPYMLNETFLLSFVANIYEPLVRRRPDLKLEPALAASWKQTNPTTWRFVLRKGVKFHDGTPFGADDVVFSYKRASGPSSDIKANFASIKEVNKVDDLTVEFVTGEPNPILPAELSNWVIMSKAWAEKNNATETADVRKNQENFATRNANGTGPFKLVSREPDVKTVLANNPDWWDKPQHNLTEVVFMPIKNDGTRTSALLRGEVDMVYTLPLQSVEEVKKTKGLKALIGPELRVVFLGFDQSRDELQESSVKGKNPFKDPRVREAFNLSVDKQAIQKSVMRGLSMPIGTLVANGINGYNKSFDVSPKVDVARAKKLLADAGYPSGFEVGMDCPNDRYVNDERICVAVAGMLAKSGINVKLTAQTKAKYFPKILARNTSFYMLGWTPTTLDAHNSLFNLVASNDGKNQGKFNLGGYSNPEVDRLTAAIRTETDEKKRNEMIAQAFTLVNKDWGYIPLHQQMLVWAHKDSVQLAQYADNFFPLRYVVVK
jgi:peptide/nickel transport system substrate-binding protein